MNRKMKIVIFLCLALTTVDCIIGYQEFIIQGHGWVWNYWKTRLESSIAKLSRVKLLEKALFRKS